LPKLNSQACGDTNYVPAATPGNLRRFTCPARIRRSLATEQTHSAARCRNRDFHFDLPAQRNMQAYLSWSRESNSFLPWKSIAAGTLRRGRFCLFPGHRNPGTAITRNRLCCIRSTDVWWLVPFALFTNGARHTSGGRFAPRSHPTTVGGQQWPSLPRPSFSYFGQQWA